MSEEIKDKDIDTTTSEAPTQRFATPFVPLDRAMQAADESMESGEGAASSDPTKPAMLPVEDVQTAVGPEAVDEQLRADAVILASQPRPAEGTLPFEHHVDDAVLAEKDGQGAEDAPDAKSEAYRVRENMIDFAQSQLATLPPRLRDEAWIEEMASRIAKLDRDREFDPADVDAIEAFVNEHIETAFIALIEDGGETDPEKNLKNVSRLAIARHATRLLPLSESSTPIERITHAVTRLNGVALVTARITQIRASTSLAVDGTVSDDAVKAMIAFESTGLRASIFGIIRCCESWD